MLRKTLLLLMPALLLAWAGFGYAQDEEMEEVVVTGSLIKGTPVDAALPVEVFTAADLQDVGAPTALEFVKSLTVSGWTYGEAYYFGSSRWTSVVGVNLRGLGTDKTLTLFNGRRGVEDTTMIPQMAIGRVEILKDGAAVTYGADAIGGVVNYITKDNFEGIEVSTQYKMISDSDGDWGIGLLGGKQFGDTNLMIALEWDHRSELDTLDRNFSSEPYWVNPAPWSTLTSLAGWYALGPLPATPGFTRTDEFGPTYGFATDFTQDSCEAVGGIYRDGFTCKYNYAPYYNIVEDTQVFRVYLQSTTDMTDRARLYSRVAFLRNYRPHQYGSPGQPVIRGAAQTSGLVAQFYVPKTNPYFAEFAARTGLDQNALYPLIQGVAPVTYRPFSHGGNDAWVSSSGSHSTPNENIVNRWHIAVGLDGTFENEIAYDVGVTFNHYDYRGTSPDVLGFRLQEAMNGFGGKDCNVPDLDPDRFGTQNAALAGTGDCMWFNPFASNFARQPMLGLTNPNHVAGSENSLELIRWIMDKRIYEETGWNLTLDFVLNGATPLELGGGPVAWGAGVQYRHREFRGSGVGEFYNGETPCAWPGQDPADPADATYTGCTPDRPGPYVFFDPATPVFANRKQVSYFLELDFPITEDLYVIAATRYEEFQPGNLDTTVYKVSFKWDVTDNFALRGSYGDNYQAPSITLVPGDVDNAVRSYTIAAGNWRGAQFVTNPSVVPETAIVWSAGVVWQSEGFGAGHEFRFIADYWDIETEDEIGQLADPNQIANAVFHINPDGSGTPPPNDGSALADCGHALAGRVTFNTPCVDGVTTADDFASIRTDTGNGAGQHTVGYDIQVNYSLPAFGGDLRFGLTGTILDKYEFTETTLDGFLVSPAEDRLGDLNFATNGRAVPEQRINFDVNYAFGVHNVRFVMGFVSAVTDERGAGVVEGRVPGTTDSFPDTRYGLNGEDWFGYDVHYHGDFPFGTVSLSIVNLLDEDPPPAREELGYDPLIGNPLGRTFELGWRKEF